MNEPRLPFTYSVRTVEVEYNRGAAPDTAYRADTPLATQAFLREWMSADRCQPDREHFIVLGLDGRHRVISAETLSTGTKNQAPVDACAIFRHLVLCGAAGFIIAHNHPSGDLDPSRDDLELTRKIAAGGRIVGVALLDHIIIAPESGRAISLRQTRADLFAV